MADVRKDKFTYVQGDGFITVLKGGLYICEIRNSQRFKGLLVGNFNPTVGLSNETLIELGNLIKVLERQDAD